MQLRKISIENLKSFKKITLPLRAFNVLVGPNGSGKTNLTEAFKLLKSIYSENNLNPFIYWWGYRNLVWQGKEELPISISLELEADGYTATFEASFLGGGGDFSISREKLTIDGVLSIEKSGDTIRLLHDPQFIEKNWPTIAPKVGPMTADLPGISKTYFTSEITGKGFSQTRSLLHLGGGSGGGAKDKVTLVRFQGNNPFSNALLAVLPTAMESIGDKPIFSSVLYWKITRYLQALFAQPTFTLNPSEMKKSSPFKRDFSLADDGGNLHTVLHNIFLKNNGWPSSFTAALKEFFPGFTLLSQPTEDGRVLTKARTEWGEINPKGLPDGLYKLLAILASLEVNPQFIIMDEIETSLHPRAIEWALDVIRGKSTFSLLTTHSPHAVDMTDLLDLIILERDAEGSHFWRTDDPEKTREKLKKLGITFSEGWLSGRMNGH